MTALDAANRRCNAITAWAPRHPAGQGPLAGMAVAVKANIDIAGMATTAGLAHRRTAPAMADAPLVARLRAAGATILGHANMDEAGLGAVTDNPHWGRTENPRRRGHTAGGSSGGSAAAVAAGLARLALGTDTLGSVRIPASYTGIFGLKPGPGLLPATGIVPLAPRLDTPGLLAASLEDLALGWAALVPPQPVPAPPVPPIRTLAVLAEVQAAPMAPAVRAGWEAMLLAARGLGLVVTQRPLAALSLRAARLGGLREALLQLRTMLADTPVSLPLARWLAHADQLPDGADAMARAHHAVHEALAHADALLLPTTPQPAFPHGERHDDQADVCALANLAGVAALSLPAGQDMDGRPFGVQIVGPSGSEASLMALAGQLLKARNMRRDT